MKRSIVFLATVMTMSLLACQDAKDEMKKNISDFSYYRNVGKQIPNETGVRWLQLYREKNNISSRTTLLGYSITKQDLTSVISSVESLVGIAFQHGTDADGTHHFIIIPIDESLSLWSGSEDRVLMDANSNEPISRETALDWAANYEQAHPNEIWFHYFGGNIFDQMLEVAGFENLDIEPALKDTDLSPQLLLIINAPELLSPLTDGRTEVESMVYDASFPCPPCPIEE